MKDFDKDSFVKIVGVNGNFHYGYIQELKEKGFVFIISLYEEGESAIEYEAAVGTISSDWENLLSAAEKTLIPLLALNLTTKNMAEQLAISPVTIRSHIRTLKLKLQLINRQQLIAFAQGIDKQLKRRELNRSKWQQ